MKKPKLINADKPHLWKADVAASVDQFNQWFMRFAPETFRATRAKTVEHVKAALVATDNLRNIDAATLRANPAALPTLRMCTAPPLAVDRLVGLTGASKTLIGRMEEGKLAARMKSELLDENLEKVCRVLAELLDREIFIWLQSGRTPTICERDQAAISIADRICSTRAGDTMKSSRRIHQVFELRAYLESRQYDEIAPPGRRHYYNREPGRYNLFPAVPAAMGRDGLLFIDAVVQPHNPRNDGLPILIQSESYSSFKAARRNRCVQHEKARALRMTYGDDVLFVLVLSGYCDADYLGTQAGEAIDWVWQHRLTDLQSLGL